MDVSDSRSRQVVSDHAVGVRVFSGQDVGSRGTAHRRVGECVAEQKTLGGELVQMGGFDVRVPHAAHGLPPHLVRKQEQDVGLFRGL